MALLEMVVRAQYFDQQTLNRYNFSSSGTPAAVSLSFGLAAATGYVQSGGTTTFEVGSLAENIRLMQNTGVEYLDIEVRNVYDPLDFYTTAFTPATTGGFASSTSSRSSPALAYGFRSNRSRLDIRRGFKRYVGVDEDALEAGGQIVQTVFEGELAAVATSLGQDATYDDEGNTLTYAHVIVSKEKYTTPSGRTAYKYYDDEATQLDNVADVSNWTPYTVIRTQGSRQYGRGR